MPKSNTIEKKISSKLTQKVAAALDAFSIPTTIIAPLVGVISAFIIGILLSKTHNNKEKEPISKKYGVLLIFVVIIKLIPIISVLPLWSPLVFLINKLEK